MDGFGDIKEFGRVVRAARERAGMSPSDLGSAIHRTASYVSRLETGQIQTPPPEVVAPIATVLRIDETRLVRLIGYLSTVNAAETVTPIAFRVNSPAAKVVDILRTLPDEHASWVLGMARHAEKEARGEKDDDDLTAYVGGSRRVGT